MNSIKLGRLGEAKAIAKLMELGYEVFTPIGGNTSVDLIALKDGFPIKVEVKTVSGLTKNRYLVQVRQVRPNRTGNVIKLFDNTSCDLLLVYIVPEDRVEVFNCTDITVKNSLTIVPQ